MEERMPDLSTKIFTSVSLDFDLTWVDNGLYLIKIPQYSLAFIFCYVQRSVDDLIQAVL